MNATQLIPPRDLEAIQSVWRVDLEGRKARYGYYYLPDNYSEVILVLKGDLQRFVIGTRQRTRMEQHKCYLAPARSKGTILYANDDVSLLIFKVRPNLHNAIIHNKCFESRNDIKELDLSAYASPSWERALRVQDSDYLMKGLYSYLEDRYQFSRGAESVIEQCMEIIAEHHGHIKVKDLNDLVGVCKSTLEEKFNKELGLSPKEFCKIEKINYFLSNHQSFQGEMTLTQLTFKSGYYDQSHLIKEFRYFVDLSPRKYLKEINKLDLRVRSEASPVMAMAG
ncbi:MAG: helix-turn-helix domain-containing protein [Bacteroidota bacterium]